MQTKKAKAKAEAYEHAADLPAAYRELKAAIEAHIELREGGPVAFSRSDLLRVTNLPNSFVWQNADAHAAAWQRIGAAARRVQVALEGRASAELWDGFKVGRAA
jgi:hypothetical protein